MGNIIIFGVGPIGIEYTKIFKSLGYSVIAVGRGESSRKSFEIETGIKPLSWFEIDFNDFLLPSIAIVAVGEAQLGLVTERLILSKCQKILVEKPGGSSYSDVEKLAALASANGCDVRVAYNRRYYASVIRGKEIIEEDGGVRSFHFDFSEWSHKIEPLSKECGVKERWFFHNSSHVVDLAFYLGGWPSNISSLSERPMSWHPVGLFVGMGKTDTGALFSYNSDWKGPGRWGIELTTEKHRLIYRPLEKLQIQEVGTIATNFVEIDESMDELYKPGFYKQVEAFLSGDESLPCIQEQLAHLKTYKEICFDQ